MLAKRFPRLDEDERLALYHEAWAQIYAKRRCGQQIESVRAYLLVTASAEALNALTRRRPPAPIGPDDPRVAALSDDAAAVDEQVVTRDQARIARDLIDSLDARQRDVLKLRWDLQLSGEEIRAALGLSRRQYARLVEEGAQAVAERVRELESGAWSRRQRSLLTACLVQATHGADRREGIATPDQRERAQRLLESDPHVAALFAEVRGSLRGVTALLPLPILLTVHDTTPLDRLAELADGLRSHAVDAAQGAKSQATSLYIRVADPTLITSPRPGAAMAVVVGALALGGGAYATHQIVAAPELSPASTAADVLPSPATPSSARTSLPSPAPHPPKRRPKHTNQISTPPQLSAPSPSPTIPQPTPPTQPQPAPAPSPEPTEFGFEN